MTDDPYILAPRDQVIINAARDLLWKLVRSTMLSARQVERVARLITVLDRMPATSKALGIRVMLVGPKRRFGDHEIYHWWEVEAEAESNCIYVQSGGHFYRPSTGGDSFTSMMWEASPGYEADFSDFLDSLRIVDDAMPFEAEIHHIRLTDAGYRVEVQVDGDFIDEPDAEENGDVDEEECDEDDEEGCGNEVEVCGFVEPVDESEQFLMQQADIETGLRLGQTCDSPPDECDFCDHSFHDRALFVDGRLRADLMWANMCSLCFYRRGEGLGCGDGQLFARRCDDSWLLVAGFSPLDVPDKDI